MEFDELSNKVIGAAIEVHSQLGPGLMESAYESCLAWELQTAGLQLQRQLAMPVQYKGMMIECGYRVDLLIENALMVELKSVEKLMPIHASQLLTYMQLGKIKTGLLMNFNTMRLKDGLKRFVV